LTDFDDSEALSTNCATPSNSATTGALTLLPSGISEMIVVDPSTRLLSVTLRRLSIVPFSVIIIRNGAFSALAVMKPEPTTSSLPVTSVITC